MGKQLGLGFGLGVGLELVLGPGNALLHHLSGLTKCSGHYCPHLVASLECKSLMQSHMSHEQIPTCVNKVLSHDINLQSTLFYTNKCLQTSSGFFG